MKIVVTGASAGIGYSTCKLLLESGHEVIGIARRESRLLELKEFGGDKFSYFVADVGNLEVINKIISDNIKVFEEVDVLVNNAGLASGMEKAPKSEWEDWAVMIQTNVVALANFTHKILPLMIKKDSGYIINMGSISGTHCYPGSNVYGATKAFVKQFSLNLRADILGSRVRVTNIEPGICGDSEFSNVRFKQDDTKVETYYKGLDYLQPIDIANTVLWLINQPQRFNVNSIEIMPTDQAFAGLATHRR